MILSSPQLDQSPSMKLSNPDSVVVQLVVLATQDCNQYPQPQVLIGFQWRSVFSSDQSWFEYRMIKDYWLPCSTSIPPHIVVIQSVEL
ncbi:hypothetical protein QQP08_006446 [Theobroma cacao]|nr:hypothetical protein QQP08_006446 [Theobroma cacao]